MISLLERKMKLEWSIFKIAISIPDRFNIPLDMKLLEENLSSSVYLDPVAELAYLFVLITPEDCTLPNIQSLVQWIRSASKLSNSVPKIQRDFVIHDAVLENTGKQVQLFVIEYRHMDLTLNKFLEQAIQKNQPVVETGVHLGFIAQRLLKAYQHLQLDSSPEHSPKAILENPAARMIFNSFVYLQRDGNVLTWLLPNWTPRALALEEFVYGQLEKSLERDLTAEEKRAIFEALESKLPQYFDLLRTLDPGYIESQSSKAAQRSAVGKGTTSIQNILDPVHQRIPDAFAVNWISMDSDPVQISNRKLKFSSLQFQVYMAPFSVYQFTTHLSSKVRTCLIGFDNDRTYILNTIQQIPWFPKVVRITSEVDLKDAIQSNFSVFVLELEHHFQTNLLDYYRAFITSSNKKIQSLVSKIDADKLAYGLLAYLKRTHQQDLDPILEEWVSCARFLTQLSQMAQHAYQSDMAPLVSHVNLFNALIPSGASGSIHIVSLIRSERIRQNPQSFLDACQFNIYNTFLNLLRHSTPNIQKTPFLINGILYLFYDRLKKSSDTLELSEVLDPVSEQHFMQIYAKVKLY